MITYPQIAAACSTNDSESEAYGNRAVYDSLTVVREDVRRAAEQRWLRLRQHILPAHIDSPLIEAAIVSMWMDGLMAGVRLSRDVQS